LWLREVLQTELPHRLQRDVGWESIGSGQPGCFRKQDLVSVSGVADAGGLMDREADVLVLLDDHVARVNAHPNLQCDAIGPRRLDEEELALRRREKRVLGGRKDGEQRVALGPEQPPPRPLERCLEKASVVQQ
jgi:hypothetical protein